MKKIALISGISIIVIAIIATLIFVLTPSVDTAYITSIKGEVFINDKLAQEGQKLSLNDIINTKENAQAVVVLYESVLVTVDPLSQIQIKDLAKDKLEVHVEKGSTWNKFLRLNGVEGYAVSTPNTVATVRGTEFSIDLFKDLVAEGIVEVQKDGEIVQVIALKKVLTDQDRLLIENFTDEDKAYVKQRLEQTLENLIQLRQHEIDKNGFLIKTLKVTYGLTDQKIQEHLDAIDDGRLNPYELYEQSIIKTDSLLRMVHISEKIADQKALIKLFE